MWFKLIIGLLYFIVSITSQELTRTCPPNANFCFTVQHQTENLKFTLIGGGSNVGYMAIGLGTDMSDSDMIIGWFDTSNKPQVIHRKGVGHAPPIESNSAKVEIINSESNSDNQIITFTYTPTANLIQKDSTFSMIWAHSPIKPDNRGNIRRHETRGGLTYSLADGTTTTAPESGLSSTVLWHGSLMLIAWLILPTAAIFIARFLKDQLGVWWFRLHFSLFGLTGILAIASIIIMAVKVGNVLQDPHSAIGVIVMLLYSIQIFLGIYIDQKWYPSRRTIPWYDKAHWWLGRTTFLLAIINIILGIVLVGNPLSLWISFIIILILAVALFVYGGIRLGKVNH